MKIRYPNITGKTPEERQQQIENHIRYMIDQLNWSLSNGEKKNSTSEVQIQQPHPAGNTAALEKKINEAVKKLDKYWETIYPIGSIYISESEANPGELFGGTWERIKDRFLLSAGDTYKAGSIGGEEEHILTVDEMPTHNHELVRPAWYSYEWQTGGQIYMEQSTTSLTVLDDTHIQFAGGSQPHNNMPPYTTVYVWKRIS